MAVAPVAAGSISLEVAEKLIPEFSGDRERLFDFLNACAKVMELSAEGQEPILLKLMLIKIKGSAGILVRSRVHDTWEQLRTFLREAYCEEKNFSQYQLELSRTRQFDDETPINYGARVTRIVVKMIQALPDNLNDVDRAANTALLQIQGLNAYVTGLLGDLHLIVMTQNPESLNEAITVAQAKYIELKSRQNLMSTLDRQPRNNAFNSFGKNQSRKGQNFQNNYSQSAPWHNNFNPGPPRQSNFNQGSQQQNNFNQGFSRQNNFQNSPRQQFQNDQGNFDHNQPRQNKNFSHQGQQGQNNNFQQGNRGQNEGQRNRDCFRCGRNNHSQRDCRAKFHVNGTELENSNPKNGHASAPQRRQ